MITRKIRFPLNHTVKRYLSAGNYNQAVGESLDFLDDVYSYFFRYPWLLEQIEGTENTQGAPIDFMSSHPIAAVGLTLIWGAAAVALSVEAVRNCDQAAEIKVGDYHHRTQSLNQHIAEIFNQNDSLKKKYKKIIITPDNQVEFTLQEEKQEADPGFWTRAKNKVRSLLFSSWVTLCICSYVYWILWIGTGVITGHFASSGVEGLGVAGFAVPLAVGALYPFLKLRNWYRKKFGKKIEDQQPVAEPGLEQRVQLEEDLRVLSQARAEIAQLLKMAILADEKARLQAELHRLGASGANVVEGMANTGSMSGDESILRLSQDKWKKAVMTGLSTAVGTYINAQYGAILIIDILKALGVVVNVAAFSFGVGIVFIACSGLYGVYKAVQRYKEVQKYQVEIAKQNRVLENSVNTLEASYHDKMERINQLKYKISLLPQEEADRLWLDAQLKQFERSTVVSLPAREANDLSTWGKIKKGCAQSYAMVGGMLLGMVRGIKSGLMLARIATIVGTVLFVPCVAMLGNPLTIGILVASALVYGLFKGYEYYQTHQEKQAKVLLEQRAGKRELLKEQCAIADLQISLLAARRLELEQRKAAAPVQAEEKAALQPQSLPLQARRTYDDESGLRKKKGLHYAASGSLLFKERSKDDLDVAFPCVMAVTSQLSK